MLDDAFRKLAQKAAKKQAAKKQAKRPPAATKRRRAGKETRAQAAQRLSLEMGFEVTQRMVQTWEAKGYDIQDADSLEFNLRQQEKLPKGMPAAPAKTPPPTRSKAGEKLDPEKVEARLESLSRELDEARDYQTTRTLSMKIKALSDIMKELREQGRYIKKEEAMKHAAQAGVAVKAAFEKIEDSLPPQLEGLTALQMKTKLREYARSELHGLANLFS